MSRHRTYARGVNHFTRAERTLFGSSSGRRLGSPEGFRWSTITTGDRLTLPRYCCQL
ncbi:hypothetical protein ACQ86I_05755 [Prescottella equi]